MKPSIQMYGGVHDDPGSRQKFIEEFGKQKTPPHFVAVEWEQSLFERLAAWRPWIAESLKSHWGFLSHEGCHELSLALAWEGDAYAERFPGANLLWLESEFQEADLKRRYPTDAAQFPESRARCLLERLCNPLTLSEQVAKQLANTAPPPESRAKKELIDRVWKIAWSEASEEPGESEGFERDARWAVAISERSSGLSGGWIAVVVGWLHADPEGDNQRLRGLLLSKGFSIKSIRLGP
jgi:hypothetical protein